MHSIKQDFDAFVLYGRTQTSVYFQYDISSSCFNNACLKYYIYKYFDILLLI